jgi:gliding motility-associated-like protein
MLKLKHILIIFLAFNYSFVFSQALYNNGREIYINPEAVIFVNGDLNNAYGSLSLEHNNDNSSELNISGDLINNANLICDGTINLYGNWINNSIFQSTYGTVNFKAETHIIGGNEETYFHNVNLNNYGLKTLNNSIHINGILNIHTSVLNTQNSGLFIDNIDSEALVFTTGFVISHQGGFISRKTQSTGEYIFPVGADYDNPIKRNVLIKPLIAELSEFNIRFVNNNPNQDGYYTSLLNDSIEYVNEDYYHIINRSAGISNVSIKIYSESEDEDFNHIANWSTTPTPGWILLHESFSDSLSPVSGIIIEEINDFSNPQFVFCKNADFPIDTIPNPNPEPDETEIIIYNSFSPNGDGLNDTWIVENCDNCSVKVYNRNGNIIYSSENSTIPWDGTFNNKRVPDATYYYIITPTDEEEIFKGSVTIIR